MRVVGLVAVALVTLAAGGCALLPSADPHAALLQPCENGADVYPWLLTDHWDDGDTYEPASQFHADGMLVYAYDGSVFNNGRWSLDGTALHMDMNKHYADYDGTFDGVKGSGTMKNQPGNKGTWTLERACDD